MFTVSKTFHFCAAHRLNFSTAGACQNLHGHNYKVNVMLGCDTLRADGMVVNFKDMSVIQDWINNRWDHTIILHSDDPFISLLENKCKMYIMKDHPTAENMCKRLHMIVQEFFPQVTLILVTIYETETCFAQYDGKNISISGDIDDIIKEN